MSIRLHEATLGYDRHPAVHHLSGSFAPGSLTAVVGPNGAGKSTLLKGIKGMLPLLSGSIEVSGANRRQVAYLPQQADIDRDFPITVLDTVLLGHWRRRGVFRRLTRQDRALAAEALAAVGLAGFAARPIGSLSIGQRQRVLFARVLVEDSPVILLDEPFAALDAKTTADLLEIVRHWHGERRTVVAVMHDLEQVRRHFPHTLLLARRLIGWGATGEILSAANLALARAMGEAWDHRAPVCRESLA